LDLAIEIAEGRELFSSPRMPYTKMLLGAWDIDIPITISLAVVASIILTSIVFSVIVARREQSAVRRAQDDSEPDSP